MHPCRRYLTPDDTHDLYVICLGKEHARDVFEEAICVHCEHFFKKKAPLSFVSLSEKKEKRQPSASRGSGPAAAEARRRMSS